MNDKNVEVGGLSSRREVILKVCLAFLVALGIGLIVWLVVLRVSSNNEVANVEEKDYTSIAMGGEATVDDLNEYIKLVDREIAETSDAEVKSGLYGNRAGILSNYLDYPDYDFKEQILNDVHKADEVYPTAYSAFSVSWYEREFGDESVAQYYQELADERGFDKEMLGGK